MGMGAYTNPSNYQLFVISADERNFFKTVLGIEPQGKLEEISGNQIGKIEQFILYPMVIGESLGLTTLETIIVVLLGAIFAGIAGMILALPAASIIKYLVPQIYRCWDVIKEKDSAAKAQGA